MHLGTPLNIAFQFEELVKSGACSRHTTINFMGTGILHHSIYF